MAEFIDKLNELGFLDVTVEEQNVMIKGKSNTLPAMKILKSQQ